MVRFTNLVVAHLPEFINLSGIGLADEVFDCGPNNQLAKG
jgi:hypothetical protein